MKILMEQIFKDGSVKFQLIYIVQYIVKVYCTKHRPFFEIHVQVIYTIRKYFSGMVWRFLFLFCTRVQVYRNCVVTIGVCNVTVLYSFGQIAEQNIWRKQTHSIFGILETCLFKRHPLTSHITEAYSMISPK